MSVASATVCGACGTVGGTAPSLKPKSSNACGRGSPTRSMHKRGGCATRSSGRAGLIPSRSLTTPLPTCVARRLLEQPTEEPPFGEPQQELGREPEQQQRVPRRPHALALELAVSRGRQACRRASRGGHDECLRSRPSCPAKAGKGRGSHSRPVPPPFGEVVRGNRVSHDVDDAAPVEQEEGRTPSRQVTRFSCFSCPASPDTPQRQERQIVQPQLDLGDFLPGFESFANPLQAGGRRFESCSAH